jgi:plastocyanin
MRINLLIRTAILVLSCSGAGAADHLVQQKGRTFSVTAMTVARGDPVVFQNDDTVPHNVMSATPENAFDLGSQMPGNATPVTFDSVGIVAVICAIHPRMHMTITVTN